MTEGSNICMCHVSKMTSVWRALVHLSKSCISICALQISGFAGLVILHLSNPAVCICRHAISTLRLEHRWISPNTMCVFSNSNHLHLQTGDLSTFVKSLLFSSLLTQCFRFKGNLTGFAQCAPDLGALFAQDPLQLKKPISSGASYRVQCP